MWRGFLIVFVTLGVSASDELPSSGLPVAELTAFDEAMIGFMTTNAIQAGALGVMKDGVVVFERAYGWADAAHSRLLLPDVMMRMASVTKPVTASAVRKLIAAGAFGLDDAVFDVGQPGGGLLSYVPFGTVDARLQNVTVRHLLEHKGGWDRSIAGDLTYIEITIANAMGVPSPPGRVNTVRYIMGQPLQYDPGTTYAYSNIGFLVLGLIVEQHSGQDLVAFHHEQTFGPMGIAPTEIELGRTFVPDRNMREPWYDDLGIWFNVFFPTYHPDWLVTLPDGTWDHEARVGQGGLITSTRAMLAFLQHYVISGTGIGNPRTGMESSGWRRNHTGSLNGTNALARQRGDGVNFVVLFNKRPITGTSYASQMRTILDGLADSTTNWPSVDPLDVPVAPMWLTGDPAGAMSWPTEIGRVYRVEYSTDLDDWEDMGVYSVGDGTMHGYTNNPVDDVGFYRVRVR